MSCPKWKEDIALYAGGDLGGGRAAQVESHLSECEGCRALLAELREDHALLSELRDAPLEDAMVAQVRRRVLAQVSEPRRQAFPAWWKLALAAALALAAILAIPRHTRKPRESAHIVVKAPAMPPPEVQPAVVPASHQMAPRRRRRTLLQHAQPRPPGPPLLVQFVTDDPNIVIYWLVDQKTEGD